MNQAKSVFREMIASMRAMRMVPLHYRAIDRYGHEMPMVQGHPLAGTMTAKECFRNAFIVSQEHKGMTYCEGIACSPRLGIPIDHAWVVDESGSVIDPTWKHADASYYGFYMVQDDTDHCMLESGVYGILPSIFAWSRGMSIHDTEATLRRMAVNGMHHMAQTATIPLDSTQELHVKITTPGEPYIASKALTSSFSFDSLVVERGGDADRCTVTGHDAEYIEKAVLSCIQSKPHSGIYLVS